MGVFNKLKEFFNNLSKKIKKDILFKKRDKMIIKQQMALYKEVEKEYKEEEKRLKKEKEEKYKDLPKSKRRLLEVKEFFDELMNNDEFEELEKYKPEKEKKREIEEKKEARKITIKAALVFVFVICISTVGLLVFGEMIKTDLEKVTQPMLEDYYLKTFNEKPKLQGITYLDKEKHIVLARFKSGINVMCVENKHIGNDSNYDSIYSDYKAYLINTMQAQDFIIHKPKLSYVPYEVNYNYYIDYIDTLPSDLNFNELLSSNSLDIVDIIIYERDINKENIKNMLNSFGNNSIIYLIKTSGQNVINFSVVTKDKIESFDVIEEKYSNQNDTFFKFDQSINKVEYVDIITLRDGYDRKNYMYTNVKKFDIDQSYLPYSGSREEDTRSEYYLVRLKKELSYDNFTLLTGYGESYGLYDEDETPLVLGIETQSGYLVFGTKEVMIGNKDTEPKSWLCRFNLC